MIELINALATVAVCLIGTELLCSLMEASNDKR